MPNNRRPRIVAPPPVFTGHVRKVLVFALPSHSEDKHIALAIPFCLQGAQTTKGGSFPRERET